MAMTGVGRESVEGSVKGRPESLRGVNTHAKRSPKFGLCCWRTCQIPPHGDERLVTKSVWEVIDRVIVHERVVDEFVGDFNAISTNGHSGGHQGDMARIRHEALAKDRNKAVYEADRVQVAHKLSVIGDGSEAGVEGFVGDLVGRN